MSKATKELGVGVYYCDTEDDFNDIIGDFEVFTSYRFVGRYDLIGSIEEEFERIGISDDVFIKATNGKCGCYKIDIIEYNNEYTVYESPEFKQYREDY